MANSFLLVFGEVIQQPSKRKRRLIFSNPPFALLLEAACRQAASMLLAFAHGWRLLPAINRPQLGFIMTCSDDPAITA